MNSSLFNKVLKRFSLIVVMLIPLLQPINAQEQGGNGITLKMQNVNLEKVLNDIESQTRYLFITDKIDLNTKVSISVLNKKINYVLDNLFEDKQIIYEIKGSNIYLSKVVVKQDNLSSHVQGVIIDNFGQPVIGAGVMLIGTTVGASTDLDGNFAFDLPANHANGVIRISCLGYDSKDVKIGNKRNFNITISESTNFIEGTVVTALGIKRSAKALSYNVQQVNSEDIVNNKDANFINSLNGKVAGLNINASSSGVGGSSKVIMRGVKSISQSSNALYVIDGVPMYTSPKAEETQFGSQGSTDPIADLNPEDIESISVLTGAAAAALYGSDAANGAIVITTKKGAEGKLTVNFTTGAEITTPFMLPKFQNSYGTGDLNSSIGSQLRSWGRKMNDANNPNYDPKSDYFELGSVFTNNVSISTGNEKNQTYLSVSSIDSRGVVPNNSYNRYNFTARNTTNLLEDKLHLDFGFTYIIQEDCNMINQGTYNNPLVGAYLFPRSGNWEAIKMFERYDPARKLSTQYWPIGDAGMTMQNPYWINYRNPRQNDKSRYMLNSSISYDILDWLNVKGRVRIDNSFNEYTEKFYASTFPQLTELSINGLYGNSKSQDKQIYADFLVNINKRFGDDWTLTANLGTSISDMRFDALENRGPIADGIITDEKPGLANVFNVQNLSNSKKTKRLQSGWREQTQSVFASAEVGFKSTYFLTLTARNDWPSQLAGPHSNRKSFFYPSVGFSVVMSELLNLPEQIEYFKLRASYASVGTAFSRYIANPQYTWNSSGLSWNTQTQYPMYDLKPELTNSLELGMTMRFLQYFNMDFSFYHTNTLNQTFDPKISTGSGSSKIYIQSGDVSNTGIEFSLGFNKDWSDFSWSSNFTMSSNKNKINSLADNVLNAETGERFSVDILDMDGIGQAHFLLKKGGTLGDLYSLRDFIYDSNGKIFVNENGIISHHNIENTEDYVKLGSVLPKANLAFRNDFKLGRFNFGCLFIARLGGIVYSSTQAVLDYYGVSQASADARDNGGVYINGGDIIDPNKWYSSIGGSNPLPTMYTYSATNVRLQEASIGYTIPRKTLGNICDLNVSVIGRNLLMLYSDAPFDPESVATTGNYYQGIDHFMMPSLRTVGINLRATF